MPTASALPVLPTAPVPPGPPSAHAIPLGTLRAGRPDPATFTHLDALEAQSITIIREAFAAFGKIGMLWSIGKDSSVMLWLVRKAFFGHVPFQLIHVDTSYKIPEMIAFRDRAADVWNLDLLVEQNTAALTAGQTFPLGAVDRVTCCGSLKKDALVGLVDKHGFDAVFAGIRRDEEGTRSKERYFSPRGQSATWNYKDQPPELWDQYKTDFAPGTHIRVHPLLHWTETNIWEYIAREQIPVVPSYFSRDGTRYRSLGCAPCTAAVPSFAEDPLDIIAELALTQTAERSTRAQDQESEHAFEELRKQGYM